ncbi:mRNA polyadenylation factor [Lithospermum erythrorhizon]|uniref:mRNA polyadenylation factor n=1 Tax=Lithospermum erythrorhizon TaxID=34254 RepID=A0AAV3S161_LITER
MLKSVFLQQPPCLASSCFSRITCGSKMSTTVEPLIRNFVPIERNASISHSDGYKFSLVSYNILAQAYVKSALFPHSPSACLKWKVRSQAILTVLKNLGADFLCLQQELDEYESFYKKNLESVGYSSIYIQRSGQKRDGCGIFYKQNCADLIIQEKIDYNDLVPPLKDGTDKCEEKDGRVSGKGSDESKTDTDLENTKGGDRGDPNDPRVRMKRDCVGVMAAFKINGPSDHHLIVANTHIFWDPTWADVKLAQAKYLLSRLAQFKTTVTEIVGCVPSIIVAGDFNSVPGDQVYKYLVSGTSLGGPQEESYEDLRIPLSSVYACTRGEPHFTNCTPGFTGTLDYILFSPEKDIKPVSLLELPESESFDVSGGLPNYQHPSDHLPIGAEFEVIC